MNNNILVTGGAGYIGSHTCKEISKFGYTPIVYDNLCTGNKWAVKWGPCEIGDINDINKLDSVLKKYKPFAVMHFAAHAYVSESIENPNKYYNNNIIGTLNLIETMIKNDIKYMVFSSTCATYGIPENIPIKESEKQNPINPYGTSKLIVEKILKNYENTKGLKSVILRYFNAAGADLDLEIGEYHAPEPHLIPRLFDVVDGNKKYISIFGNDYNTRDGTCIRDYIHVKDISSAHIMSIDYLQKHQKTQCFNLGTGQGYSVKEIIDSVSEITKKSLNKKYKNRRTGDPAELVSSGDLAREKLGWLHQYSDLDTIIKSAWDWHKKKDSISLL